MNTARLNPGIPLLLNGVTKRYGDNTILNAAPAGRSGKTKRRRAAGGRDAPGGNPGRHPDDVSGCAPAAVENSD